MPRKISHKQVALLASWPLQWGRGSDASEDFTPWDAAARPAVLQWGRGSDASEDLHVSYKASAVTAASMGPRQ